MKIFAVYSKVKLTTKSAFFDNFRKKYDESYDLHITLKQPCNIEDKEVVAIENKLRKLILNFQVPDHKINLVFDQLVSEKENSLNILMIKVKESKLLRKLQEKIRDGLKGYDRFYEEEMKKYEEDFQPHITIARNLDEENYKRAIEEIGNNFLCEGFIENVVLSVVDKINLEESRNPKNLTCYKL